MFQKNIIYVVVIIIGSLLLTDILFTRHNNTIIKHNKDLQIQTETIKRYHDQIGRFITQHFSWNTKKQFWRELLIRRCAMNAPRKTR